LHVDVSYGAGSDINRPAPATEAPEDASLKHLDWNDILGSEVVDSLKDWATADAAVAAAAL
jgi:hypothetical protein